MTALPSMPPAVAFAFGALAVNMSPEALAYSLKNTGVSSEFGPPVYCCPGEVDRAIAIIRGAYDLIAMDKVPFCRPAA